MSAYYDRVVYTSASCEDAEPAAGQSLVAVADGMGGTGALRLKDHGEYRTHAYVASRLCMQAVRAACTQMFIDQLFQTLDASEDGCESEVLLSAAEMIGHKICGWMKDWMDSSAQTFMPVMGQFAQLPTTLAMAMMRERENEVDVISLWSGDSRIYALTGEGLHQLSQDNLVTKADCLELLRSDGVVSTYVNMSKPYSISVRRCTLPKPCILFAATDGAFMYHPTPLAQPNALQMEHTLLWKMNKPDLHDAALALQQYIGRTTCDDATMAIAAYADSYDQVHQMIIRRGNAFVRRYSRLWKDLPEDFMMEDHMKRARLSLEAAENARKAQAEKEVRALIQQGDPRIYDCCKETFASLESSMLCRAEHMQEQEKHIELIEQELQAYYPVLCRALLPWRVAQRAALCGHRAAYKSMKRFFRDCDRLEVLTERCMQEEERIGQLQLAAMETAGLCDAKYAMQTVDYSLPARLLTVGAEMMYRFCVIARIRRLCSRLRRRIVGYGQSMKNTGDFSELRRIVMERPRSALPVMRLMDEENAYWCYLEALEDMQNCVQRCMLEDEQEVGRVYDQLIACAQELEDQFGMDLAQNEKQTVYEKKTAYELACMQYRVFDRQWAEYQKSYEKYWDRCAYSKEIRPV